MADKNSFLMYGDYETFFECLDDAGAGKLILAIFAYQKTGEEPEFEDTALKMAFAYIKNQMDRDNAKYQETVEKRKEAGKSGGRPPKANDFSEKQEKAKKANGFSEKQNNPDNDNENDNDLKEKDTLTSIKKEKRKRFTPPTVDEVRAYCAERGNDVDPETFVDHYAASGWKRGRGNTPIVDWKACVRTWEKRNEGENSAQISRASPAPNRFNNYTQRDIDYDALAAQAMAETYRKT